MGCTILVNSKSFFNAIIPHSMNGQDLEVKTMTEYNKSFSLSSGDILALGDCPAECFIHCVKLQ